MVGLYIVTCHSSPVRNQNNLSKSSQRVRISTSGSSANTRQLSSCTTAEIEADYATLKQSFATEIVRDPTLIPAYVRAAFHDCFPATSDKPKSGCNGSIRLPGEQAQPANQNLLFAIASVINAAFGTCVSVADAIQLASAVAIKAAGGPDIVSDVVDSSKPREDALVDDTVAGELPSPGGNHAQLLEIYRRKGFDDVDLVSSSAGGHSLGRFSRLIVADRVPFTNETTVISGHYSFNLVQKRASGTNLNGFNTLRSDDALNEDVGSRAKLDSYAGCTQSGGACSPDFSTGLTILNADFRKFLIKLSQLDGVKVKQVEDSS